jgi:Phenazine biosynthesis-like protein
VRLVQANQCVGFYAHGGPEYHRVMPLPVFLVDASTAEPLAGNPAAVCPLAVWLDDDLLQAVAAENNLPRG